MNKRLGVLAGASLAATLAGCQTTNREYTPSKILVDEGQIYNAAIDSADRQEERAAPFDLGSAQGLEAHIEREQRDLAYRTESVLGTSNMDKPFTVIDARDPENMHVYHDVFRGNPGDGALYFAVLNTLADKPTKSYFVRDDATEDRSLGMAVVVAYDAESEPTYTVTNDQNLHWGVPQNRRRETLEVTPDADSIHITRRTTAPIIDSLGAFGLGAATGIPIPGAIAGLYNLIAYGSDSEYDASDIEAMIATHDGMSLPVSGNYLNALSDYMDGDDNTGTGANLMVLGTTQDGNQYVALSNVPPRVTAQLAQLDDLSDRIGTGSANFDWETGLKLVYVAGFSDGGSSSAAGGADNAPSGGDIIGGPQGGGPFGG